MSYEEGSTWNWLGGPERERFVAVTDWVDWHRAYDKEGSSLARRLAVVRQRVHESLEALGSDARRVLSLCAGDGRDVIPVLAGRPADQRPVALLVESEDELASGGESASRAAGLDTLRVLQGDAGDLSIFVDYLPVDLLMLCGIFGNISDDDIKATVAAVPSLVSPGGFVIWTRGNREPDLRLQIRGWFVDAGLAEVRFDGHPEPFGVGVSRITAEAAADNRPLPDRLFTFLR